MFSVTSEIWLTYFKDYLGINHLVFPPQIITKLQDALSDSHISLSWFLICLYRKADWAISKNRN